MSDTTLVRRGNQLFVSSWTDGYKRVGETRAFSSETDVLAAALRFERAGKVDEADTLLENWTSRRTPCGKVLTA